MKFSPNALCPCGSSKKYKKCCKIFHDEILPKTALELMKSRYCAYATQNANYIISTTHQNNKDFSDDIKSWSLDILDFCKNTEFRKLDILEFIDGETESFVTFKAHLIQQNQDVSFLEKSRFLKVDGKWLYVDGNFLEG